MAHILPGETLDTCSSGLFYCFNKWAYDVTQGAFHILMLLAFCVAIYMATARLSSTRAFGYASFVGMLGAIWFAIMQFMSWWIASAFILVGIIGIVGMILNEK